MDQAPNNKMVVAPRKKGQALVDGAKGKKNLRWGGMIPKPQGTQENAVVAFCNQVAEIYGVPSMGINVMGNQPYLNKDGRLYLLNELRRGKVAVKAIRKEFIQFSTALDMPAIIKATLVFVDGKEIEAIGEASKDNVKLEAVKKTLNMMAETRAINRAIWQEIAGDVWNRVAHNLEAVNLPDNEKAKIIEAGRTSYEEMAQPVKDVSSNFERAIIIISKSTDVNGLIEMDAKIGGSGKYSDDEKKQIHNTINKRVEELTV